MDEIVLYLVHGGGVPHLGKIPTFSRFFWGGSVPKIEVMMKQSCW